MIQIKAQSSEGAYHVESEIETYPVEQSNYFEKPDMLKPYDQFYIVLLRRAGSFQSMLRFPGEPLLNQ